MSPPDARVVAVASDPQCLFELGVAAELFGLERPELATPWYEFRVVAADPGPIRSLGGMAIEVDIDLDAIGEAGTVVLPGWSDPARSPSPALVEALRRAHGNGARLLSICSGVFPLAATGLLDGRSATTHWRYAEMLAVKHPAIDVRPNVLFVDEGQLLTSAGSAAGIDLCLHLIRRDHGAAIAAEVARRLVVAPQREGGQAQFIDGPSTSIPGDAAVASLLEWMRANLDRSVTVTELARRASMSPRTFARRFVAEVGVTPARWLARERVRAARALLETTDRSVEEVATAVGFGSAETLRAHVRRELETTPSRYRAAFAASGGW